MTNGNQVSHRSVIDNIAALRSFVAVIETGSFSEAGRRLRVVPSTISKHVSALESSVSGQLIIRSTKRLNITELGRRFYERALTILHEVEQAEIEIGEYNAEPQGVLKISAATVFATHHLGPIFRRFLDRHPKIKLDVQLSTIEEDLVASGLDVAIRISNQLDPGLIALKLAENMRVYCAAPSYLERYGTPESVLQLVDHNCLGVQGVSSSARWPRRNRDESIDWVAVSGNLVTNSGDLIRQALLSGLGIGHLARFMVHEHIESGELVELFPESRIVSSTIYAVYVERKNLPLKTRAFLNHLRMEFRVPPAWAS